MRAFQYIRQPFLAFPSLKGLQFVKGCLWTSGCVEERHYRWWGQWGHSTDAKGPALYSWHWLMCLKWSCGGTRITNSMAGHTIHYDKSRICGGSFGGEGALIAAAGFCDWSKFSINFVLIKDLINDLWIGRRRHRWLYCIPVFHGIFGTQTTPEIVQSKGIYPSRHPNERNSCL